MLKSHIKYQDSYVPVDIFLLVFSSLLYSFCTAQDLRSGKYLSHSAFSPYIKVGVSGHIPTLFISSLPSRYYSIYTAQDMRSVTCLPSHCTISSGGREGMRRSRSWTEEKRERGCNRQGARERGREVGAGREREREGIVLGSDERVSAKRPSLPPTPRSPRSLTPSLPLLAPFLPPTHSSRSLRPSPPQAFLSKS